MDYTKEQIQEKLNILVGKKVDNYDIVRIIRAILNEVTGNEQEVFRSFTWEKSIYQRINFRWKGKYLFGVDYKKKKGESHYTWITGSYTDYTFKLFEISVLDEFTTLNEQIAKCVSEFNKSQQFKKDEEAKAKEIYEHIINNFDLTGYSLYKLLKIIDEKEWTWKREKEGE